MFFNISFVIVNNQRSILEEMKHLHLSILIVFLSIGMGFDAGAQSIVQSSNDVQSSKISLYPNPATDFFSIAPGEEKIKNISISNIVGKEIFRIDANQNLTYNIEGLKRGIYIIRVFNSEDKMIKALKLSKS